MAGMDYDPLNILKGSEIFRLLPEAIVRDLASAGRVERYEQRTLLVSKGQRPGCLRYIVDGSLELLLSTTDGRVSSLPVASGNWANWVACLGDTALPYELWSSKSSVCMAYPRQQVYSAISKHPEALLKLIELIGERLHLLVRWTLYATLHSPEQRLGHLLLIVSGAQSSTSSPCREAAMTQEQIGQIGFGSRQRVARLLRNLEAKGLVQMSYGSVSVPSWERLNRFVFD